MKDFQVWVAALVQKHSDPKLHPWKETPPPSPDNNDNTGFFFWANPCRHLINHPHEQYCPPELRCPFDCSLWVSNAGGVVALSSFCRSALYKLWQVTEHILKRKSLVLSSACGKKTKKKPKQNPPMQNSAFFENSPRHTGWWQTVTNLPFWNSGFAASQELLLDVYVNTNWL